MNNSFYIDGNLLVKNGIFHALNVIMYSDEKFKRNCDVIISCNENGVYEITENSGSMFATYYVKGGITIYGENESNILCFKKEYEQTFSKYKEIQSKIFQLIEETVIPEDCENYFYQQQFISLIGNLEYFLYGIFMWETCQSFESYRKVLPVLSKNVRNEEIQHILKGEHCNLQEITFIQQIKSIIYHNVTKVKNIYKSSLGIDVDLGILRNEINIRHDIVHRVGYTKEGFLVQITKEDVISLNNKIDCLVNDITLKIEEKKLD